MLRERIIDISLLIALVCIAAVIIWTLFSANFSFPQRASTPNTTQVQPEADPAIIPLLPEGSGTPSAGGSVIAVTPEVSAAPTEGTANINQPVAETELPPVEAVTPALPEGALELERIGFSFVTGGPGACGMTLESWTHVAVSRDILERYPCGSVITIQLSETVGGRNSFLAVVGDTMNPVHSRTVNVYVGQDEPALQYGVREGSLIP